jgi:hypothetical protein
LRSIVAAIATPSSAQRRTRGPRAISIPIHPAVRLAAGEPLRFPLRTPQCCSARSITRARRQYQVTGWPPRPPQIPFARSLSTRGRGRHELPKPAWPRGGADLRAPR